MKINAEILTLISCSTSVWTHISGHPTRSHAIAEGFDVFVRVFIPHSYLALKKNPTAMSQSIFGIHILQTEFVSDHEICVAV